LLHQLNNKVNGLNLLFEEEPCWAELVLRSVLAATRAAATSQFGESNPSYSTKSLTTVTLCFWLDQRQGRVSEVQVEALLRFELKKGDKNMANSSSGVWGGGVAPLVEKRMLNCPLGSQNTW